MALSESAPATPLTPRVLAVVALLTALGTAATCYVFWPGFMSPDSVFQLAAGRVGEYGDWHPPVVTWLLGRFDALVTGPGLMLVFHAALFWAGVSLIVACLPLSGVRFVLVPLIGFFPPVFAILGTIWKDVALGVSYLFASALVFVLARHEQPTRRTSAACLSGIALALFYGTAARHNGPAAVLPLALWGAFVVLRGRGVAKTVGVALVALLGLMLTTRVVDRLLTGGKSNYPIQQILTDDLVAMSLATGVMRLPSEYRQVLGYEPTLEDFVKIYTPAGVVPLYCCDDSVRRLKLVDDGEVVAALRRQWLETIPQNLYEYLLHRWNAFASQMGIGRPDVCYPFHRGVDANDQGVTFEHNAVSAWVDGFLDAIKDTLLFRGWLYLVALALMMGMAFTVKGLWRYAVLALSASGFAYGAAYFLVSTSCDFRFQWWCVLALLVAVVLWGTGLRLRGGSAA